MALTPGTRLGPYEVSVLIGAGGMGEVYRAADTHLKRQVAIKVLPESVATDPERMARFQREAEVLASLSHPNIAAVHGLEKSDGRIALVMELVEGPTLADRIARGALPVDEALPIARQIAEALEAAHELGVVHRDLKPANIKVRPDGTVKVLDFGLAKALEPASALGASPGHAQTMAPTVTTPAMTQAGIILGTAAYMSPEQARGKPVDRRADIWAFACVFYEMLTGRRVFEGEDVSVTLADVIRAEPAWERLPRGLSPTLVSYLKRCLAKDPAKRVRDIGDVRLALEGAFDLPVSPAADPATGRPARPGLLRAALPWAAGIALGLGAGVLLWQSSPMPDPGVLRFDVMPAEPLQLVRPGLAIAPDGSRIVYAAGGRLYVHSFEQGEPVPVRGSEGGEAPFFSPDGTSIGFFTLTELKRAPLGEGLVSTLARTDSPGLRGAWNEDGTIVYGRRGMTALLRVSDTGASVGALTTRAAGDLDHDYPSLLPDGRSVLFTYGWFPWNRSEVRVASLDTGEWRTVYQGGFFPQYVESGHLVYAQSGDLWAVPFDLSRLEVTGNPVPAVPDVWQMGTGAQFAVSRSGTLAYVPGHVTADAFSTPVWVDRETGDEERLELPAGFYTDLRLSPDGRRLAYSVSGVDNVDVWVWDLAGKTRTKVTFDQGDEDAPLWTTDGQRIVFRSTRDGGGLFWRAADVTGEPERLADGASAWPSGWSADGRLLFTELSGDQRDVKALAIDESETPEVLLGSPFDETRVDVSRDGRWMAYESNESDTTEIYVRPLDDLERTRFQVSTSGGMSPRWSADGSELYFVGPTHMMVTRVQTSPSFSRSQPEPLFDVSQYVILRDPWARTYDVSPDGRRFVMIREVTPVTEDGTPPRIRVVRNWTEDLKRRVPVD